MGHPPEAMPSCLPLDPGPATLRCEAEFLPEIGYEEESARSRRQVGVAAKLACVGMEGHETRTARLSHQAVPTFGFWGVGRKVKEVEKVESELEVVFGMQEVPTTNPLACVS